MSYAQVLTNSRSRPAFATKSTARPNIAVQSTRFDPLVRRYIDHIRFIDNLAASTCKSREALLKAFSKALGSPDVMHIALQDIDAYLIGRRATCEASTVNQDKQALRGFFEYCQTRCFIELAFDYTMIKRSREKPPEVDTFEPAVIRAVINNCDKDIDALLIAVLYETGIRISELANLRVEDLRETEVRIRGKGGDERVVMMTPELAASVRNHLISRGIGRGHVFQPLQHHWNHPNVKFGTSRLRERIQHQFKRYGIQMHPHQLRHSFALNWLHSGGNIRSLQKLLGHDSLETTQRYLNLTDSHLGEEYRRHFTSSVYIRQQPDLV